MQNAIFRVAEAGAALHQMADAASPVLVMLTGRQAVARLDDKPDQDWFFVFADTPGEGLYVGFVARKHLRPIEVAVPREPSEGHVDGRGGRSDLDPGQRLSRHFLLEEFLRSETALAKNIKNIASGEEIERLKMVAGHMEEIRALLGHKPIRVTSGFRSEKLNRLVNGVSNSAHRLGYAVDFVCPTFGSPFEICKAIVNSGVMAHIDQIIQEKNRWVHISFAPEKRGQVLTLFEGGGGRNYKPGLHLGVPRDEFMS